MRPTRGRRARSLPSVLRAPRSAAVLAALLGCAASGGATALLLGACESELAQTPSPDGGGVCDAGDGAIGCEPDGQVIPCERWNLANHNCIEMGFFPVEYHCQSIRQVPAGCKYLGYSIAWCCPGPVEDACAFLAPPDGGAGVDPDAELPPACGEESRLPEDDWICAALGLPPVAADCPHDSRLWCTQWGCCEWNRYGGNLCAPWASDDGRVCCPYQSAEP